jgi:hypothetical protein
MRCEIVADDLAVLHDESDALAFGDVGEGSPLTATTSANFLR